MKTGIYWQDPKYRVKGMDFIFDPSLVLYLPLYRLDGASFMSKEAHEHLCTATGALWTPRGRSFDGVDDYINCGNNESLYADGSHGFTIEMWINPTDAGEDDFGYLFDKFSDTVGFRTYMSGGPNITFLIYINGVMKFATSTGDKVSYGAWHHIVCVYDGSNVLAYVDTEKFVGDAVTGLIDDHSGKTLYIGQRSDGNYNFHGLIGEARIYNRALTPLEIQRNYLSTKGRYQ